MIQFVDLRVQYQSIKAEIDRAVLDVLENGQFVLGSEVARFEEAFAKYCGVKHAIGVNSGTSALHLALLAGGVGPGDEVITTAFTFVATVAAIGYTGAKPVLVDIDPASYTMDPGQIEAKITSRTKAIIPVHLYGHPAEMDPIVEIARRHHLLVIEDAAQAHGAEYKGRRVGGIGDLGCFSHYPGKNLGAYGEAGTVTTNNPGYNRVIRMLRDWGAERRYHHDLKGYNYRMEGIQGAILGVKLRHLENWTQARRAHATRYNEVIKNLVIPESKPYVRHVYHIYAIRTGRRPALQQALSDHNIQTGIHYPFPIHLLRAWRDLGHVVGDFPIAEQVANEVLSLPMYPELTTSQIEVILEALNE